MGSEEDRGSADIMVAEYQEKIDQAYKLMESKEIAEGIVKSWDTDGDGKVSKEEFLVSAMEGYDVFDKVKRGSREPSPPKLKRLRTEGSIGSRENLESTEEENIRLKEENIRLKERVRDLEAKLGL